MWWYVYWHVIPRILILMMSRLVGIWFEAKIFKNHQEKSAVLMSFWGRCYRCLRACFQKPFLRISQERFGSGQHCDPSQVAFRPTAKRHDGHPACTRHENSGSFSTSVAEHFILCSPSQRRPPRSFTSLQTEMPTSSCFFPLWSRGALGDLSPCSQSGITTPLPPWMGEHKATGWVWSPSVFYPTSASTLYSC